MSVLVPFVHTSAASVPKPVRVRLPEAQISDTSVPKVVSERVVEFQTLTGMEVASEEDAASTVASVLLLTALVMPDVALLVFAFTSATTELEAVCTSSKVARLPEVSAEDVSERVPYAQTSAAVSPPPPETAEIARSMLFAST